MSRLAGTTVLLRAFLRRDRWLLLGWTVAVVLVYWSQAVSVEGLYPTQAELDRAAAALEGNTAMTAMAGPTRALDTVGGQVAWQASAFGAVLVGLMSMFVVGGHTRAEEESGRDELVRAAAVGRSAPTTAAALVALGANVVVGLLVAASLAAVPLDAADSLGLGLGLTGVGWVFTGTALVAAQLGAATRSTYGLAGAVIGVAYTLRAVGDLDRPLLTWLSPIGWYQGMHAFSGLRWWPVLLLAGGAAVAVAAAYALFDRRDAGAGLLPARPGPARADRGLRSGLGLAWRLQRGGIVGWTAGMLLLGLAYGSIGDDVGDLIGDSEASRDVLVRGGGDLVDGFYAASIVMIALIATGFAVSSATRPRGEETAGHAEVLLATALRRRAWWVGHVAMTLLGILVVLGGAGVGLGGGYALVTGDLRTALRLGTAVLPYAAPVLVVSGLARLLHGAAPRVVGAAWSLLGLAAVVLLFGELLRLPGWLRNLSPFEHLAAVPAEDFRWLPFVLLLGVAAALSLAGQVTFRRRDIG